jgi:competence protein ComEA
MKSLLLALGLALALAGAAFARVNVNTATQEELVALPEVGPVKAKAIVDYRKKNGPFKSLTDLDRVAGVGEVTLKAIKDLVTFSGAPAAAAAPAKAAKPAVAAKPVAPSAAPAAIKKPAAPQAVAPKANDASKAKLPAKQK